MQIRSINACGCFSINVILLTQLKAHKVTELYMATIKLNLNLYSIGLTTPKNLLIFTVFMMMITLKVYPKVIWMDMLWV